MNVPTPNNKVTRYLELVEDRKICRACKDLKNPSEIKGGAYDSDEIGPWSRWQGNLDAELMVVGQDWGDDKYFEDHCGLDDAKNDANRFLRELLAEAGFDVADVGAEGGRGTVFLTNAILCLKSGGLGGPVKSEWFRNCGRLFLRPLIDIVEPKVVVGLGKRAYEAVLRVYGIQPGGFREAVDCQEPTKLRDGVAAFAVYHCGRRGQNYHRNPDDQRKD